MNFPEDLKYTKDHEWVKVDGNVATIGITEFAQSELGELVFVDLPEKGKQLKAHATACVVESTKAASDVYSPISGTVQETNAALRDNPTLINTDPYKSGWMMKLEKFSSDEVKGLMTAAQYKEHLGGRV